MKNKTQHLTEEQILWSVVSDEDHPETIEHLESCATCMQTKANLMKKLAGLSAALHQMTPEAAIQPLDIERQAHQRRWPAGIVSRQVWQAVAASVVLAIAGYTGLMMRSMPSTLPDDSTVASLEFLFEDFSAHDSSLSCSYLETFAENEEDAGINELLELIMPDVNGTDWQPANG